MSAEATRARVEQEIATILCEALEVPAVEIVPAARIIDDLGAESIDLLDIRFRIERTLGIRISNEDLVIAFGEATTAMEFRELFTVEAIVRYLTERLEEAGE
jgi:acyl carrier protein